MSFNIFGPATKDSIRVGYISTDRGFVDGVTICDANDYAKLNPGTQFIFKTRDFVKYLNINEVNRLTPNDIISTGSSCSGIQLDADCGRPQAYFYGGGGVGVQGNPVIGEDGALLAVDLVHGGFGYQYPPLVEVRDNCGVGVGAVTRSVIGEIVETVEYYDQEGDFEEYEICEPTDVGYGLRYGPNGEVLGKWDPTLYANLTPDPIAIQIKEYQDFLQKKQNPWWTTRSKNPLRVTSGSRTTRVKHNVVEPQPGGTWTEFLNTYAISPVPPSNARGTDFGADLFTFEWEEEFPYDGEYIFRGSADGEIRNLYLDNEKLATLANYNNSPVVVNKTLKAGVHRIRLDLKNGQIRENVIRPSVVQPTVRTQQPFNIQTSYTGVRNVPNNFRAGVYKITAVLRNQGNPGGIAIEVKKQTNNQIIFDSLRNISSANRRLLPITQLSRSEYEQLRNAAAYSDGFLIRSGVSPENLQSFSTTTIEWNNIIFSEDGNYQVSVCVDDSVDLTFSFVSELPNSTAPSPPPASRPSTQTTGSQTRKIFNTIDYINRANRQLWRLDTRAGRDSAFINQYGVLPFDPNSTQAQTESFAGIHTIIWDNINFPVDGNYNIEIMVDDDVTLRFVGNGPETVITKIGYSSPGRSTGKSLETRSFRAGNYRLIAELKQINVGPLGRGNPMALAVNIETSVVEEEVVSPKSWNENPMGVALTIDAPLPPIPQEPIPRQEGRCPNNPIWSTRFPNAKQKWWPVNFNGPPGFQWSQFMNRYAISPIPPLSKKGSDGGGIVYSNEWDVDIPYDGFYAFKSTVDNAGRILVDNKVIMQANYIPTNLRNTKGGSGIEGRSGIEAVDGGVIYNFRENNPKSKKVFLTKGRHKIQIEVENGVTETFEKINKKVFSTKDWMFPPRTRVVQTIRTTDEYRSTEELYGPEYRDVEIVSTGSRYDRPVPAGYTFLRTTHQGNMARGGSTGRIFRGPAAYYTEGNRVYWNYHPDARAIPGTEVVRGRVIERTRPLGTDPYVEGDYEQLDPETRITRGALVRGGIYGLKVWRKTADQTSSPVQTTNVDTTIVSQSPTAAGVVYEGPTPIASYPQPITGRTEFISPLFQDINARPSEEIQGRTWIFRWSNVDFPVTGQYTLNAEGDDLLIVKVDGVEVGRAKVFEGRRRITFNAKKGKRTVELELSNIRIPNTGFQQNPVIGFAEITVQVDSPTGISKPWTENPMGISAILIPPPCPKKIKGKGVVTDVIVDDPGNGFPRPGTGGYPVALRLKNVIVEDPGINYSCGTDKIQITPSNGAVLDYECDTFGRIVNVNVLNPGLGFTNYPEITLPSDTGINATFRPQFEVVRDPIVTQPQQQLIQVTDLVGLKQTGYIDGRPYYGAVFSKDGIRYAGFYETPGDLVQVYATLQESIDAKVTTPPSAIQRQGTDVSSNNPRLNIPGTPENLI